MVSLLHCSFAFHMIFTPVVRHVSSLFNIHVIAYVDHFFLWDNGSLSGRFQWPSSFLQPSDEPKTISFLEHPDFCHLCPILCTNFLVLNLCTLMYLFRPLQSQGSDSSVDGFWQLPCNIGKRIVESFWIFSASLTTFRYLTPH